jgi:hypothetical protein
MNDQFKRMQELAGLITEGMGAYEYEKGKEAGEKIEKKKMKKSKLKKQIKEMILAEMDIDITNDADFYDPVYEAKVSPDNRVEFLTQALQHVWNMGKGNNSIDFKDMAKSTISDMFDDLNEAKKKDKEEVEDVTVDDTEISTEIPAEPVSPSYDVQKELMDALEAAKSIGDEKLVRQIGNALTYFTRTQVADKEAPTMSEGMEDDVMSILKRNGIDDDYFESMGGMEIELGTEEWMDVLSDITGKDAYEDEMDEMDDKKIMTFISKLENLGIELI